MSLLVGLMLMSAEWGPPPPAALDSAPGFGLTAHGYVAGWVETLFGRQPIIF